MKRQTIRSHEINNSTVYQVGGDLVLISNESESQIDYCIYFIYGDSDVQFLLYGVGEQILEREYYYAMDNAFRLLLAFKPHTSRVVISASSVVSSYLTRRLIQHYRCLSNTLEPHFSILRREPNWDDYFGKRRENTKKLKHLEKYAPFYNNLIAETFKEMSIYRKNTYAGTECTKIWIEKAERIITNIAHNSYSENISLKDSIEELYDTIFVWENIQEKLNERGIVIPNWSHDLQYTLVESYLLTFADFVLFPSGINLSWDFSLDKLSFYFTNISLLNFILNSTDSFNNFSMLSPQKLLKFIGSEDFLEYKNRLDKSRTVNEIILNARKYQQYLKKAFKSIY